jgi:DNA mismatch repair protein MutS2
LVKKLKISEKYFNNKIKELLGEFMRIIEIENSKRKKSYHQGVKGIIEKKKVIQEVTVQVEEIRKERKRKN